VRILIFGAAGYLGTHYSRYFAGSAGTAADIADRESVEESLDRHSPEVVLNCAGKTGRPTVDWCESHRAETLRSNVLGPVVLAEACRARRILLVHLSSGCLYEGANEGRGFSEADPPNFTGSFYVRSKTCAELLLQDFPVLILRPRMPFDDSLHPRGLIGKLVRYRRVLDTPNSLTYVPDLLAATRHLISVGQIGVFNVTNPGVTSPLDIMCRYRDVVDPKHVLEPLSAAELDRQVVARRSNCQLCTRKLEETGYRARPVTCAIDEALQQIRNQVSLTRFNTD